MICNVFYVVALILDKKKKDYFIHNDVDLGERFKMRLQCIADIEPTGKGYHPTTKKREGRPDGAPHHGRREPGLRQDRGHRAASWAAQPLGLVLECMSE